MTRRAQRGRKTIFTIGVRAVGVRHGTVRRLSKYRGAVWTRGTLVPVASPRHPVLAAPPTHVPDRELKHHTPRTNLAGPQLRFFPISQKGPDTVQFDLGRMDPETIYEYVVGGERQAVRRLADGTLEFYSVEKEND